MADGSLVFDTKIDTKGIDKGLKDIEKKSEGFSIGKGIAANLGADTLKDGLRALGNALEDVAKTGMEFEASMSMVKAVSNVTGKTFTDLTNLAREYGGATVFSASECADGLNYMAMAGWNAKQMAAGLPSVLNLASVSGIGLAGTSDIVTDALTAFGMKAEDSGHFADVLAVASSNANTNVAMMGETFKYVAPVAGALGYTVDDMAVGIGLMANAGIKASQAGTSLRTFLSNLTEPTDKQAAAMRELGISITDSTGKMKPFITLAGDLRTSFANLSEAQKASYASILAGSEGMSGLLAIVNAADSDFENLTDAVNNADGACDRMAETMTDNLSGGMKELSSAAEDAKIEIYDAVKPMIKDALPGIKGFFAWIKDNAGSIGNLLKPIGGALQVIFAVLKPILAVLSPIMSFVGKLTGFIGDFFSVISGSVTEVEDFNGTMTECKAAIESTSAALQQAKEDYGENSDEVRELQRELDTLNAQYEKGGGEAAVYADKISEIKEAYEELKESQEEAMSAIDSSQSSGMRAVSMLQKLSEKAQLTSSELDLMGKYADYLNQNFDCNIKVNYKTGDITGFDPKAVAKQVADKINQNRSQQSFDYITSEKYSSGYMKAAEAYYTNYEKLRNMQIEFDRLTATKTHDFNGRTIYANTERYLELEKLIPQMRDELSKNKDVYDEMNADLLENGKLAGMDADAVKALQESMTKAAVSGSEFVSVEEEANAKLSEQEEKAAQVQYGIEAAQGIISDYESEIEIAKAYDAAYDAALKSFEGQFGLFDKAQADSEATVSSAQAALDSQLAYWQSYNENLNTLKGKTASELGITQENFNLLLSSLSDGSEKSAGLLQSLLAGGDEAVAEMANTLGELDKTRQEAAETARDINYDLDAEMQKVQNRMNEAVEELNLSADARQSAEETINAYADGIKQTMRNASEAAQSVVDAVKAVFNNANLTFTAGGASGSVKIEHNARGTTNASDIFVAGENGPELVVGKGGSTVFPTSETARIVDAVGSLIPNTSSLYNSLLSGIPSMPFAGGSPPPTQSETGNGGIVVKPSLTIYIGDNEIKDFVIDTVTSENAATGGMSF